MSARGSNARGSSARGSSARGSSARGSSAPGAGLSTRTPEAGASRLPRILTIMGSGETAPTLAKVHRAVIARLGRSPVPAVLIDTPYGFQENADDISGRAMDYFRESVGNPIAVASLRGRPDGADPLERSTTIARIRDATYVFAGPGSPSYALRHWRGTEIPPLLASKLATGGALTIASAAALTIGIVTLPVYEIYKVGEEPHWLDGLDLLGPLGLNAAVLPHYDNTEGGNHDTRFCYMGERRLGMLEEQLPDGAWILGVDGHTALTFDVDAGTATVAGHGGATVRAAGRSTVFPSGTTVTIAELVAASRPGGAHAQAPAGEARERDAIGGAVTGEAPDAGGGESLGEAVAAIEQDFDEAVRQGDLEEAVRAVLSLDDAVVDWSRDTGLADDYAHARAVLRSLVVQLGEIGVDGTRDRREPIAPFVDALLELRERARSARDWATADLVRDRLVAAGVEVHDAPSGTTWEIGGDEPGAT